VIVEKAESTERQVERIRRKRRELLPACKREMEVIGGNTQETCWVFFSNKFMLN
jgi:hypothetical protein